NAFTGAAGRDACAAVVSAASAALNCPAEQIFVASTGAIGQELDPAPITSRVPDLLRDAATDGWTAASKAIMTTDTYSKVSSATAKIGGVDIRISGMAKGAGMIAPDMATMLAFVATNAPV